MKNTVTRYVGMCPICEGEHKLTVEKDMVHHGYKRPGDGHIEGDCMAVGHPPYEVSCDITKVYCGQIEAARLSAESYLAKLKSGEVTEILVGSLFRNQPPRVVKKGDGDWSNELRCRMSEVEHRIESLTREIERAKRLIANWIQQPLRTVQEFEGANKSERDAAKAKRDADKAAKLADTIARYQERLATALRKRTPSTVADIFETAPRKLGDMTGCSRAQAYAMLDRNSVFRAFGLDPAQSTHFDSANYSIMGKMRYTAKKDYPWPEYLK